MKIFLLTVIPALVMAQELKQLAGYSFLTNPHSTAVLDLDLKKMRERMALGEMAHFRDAQEIYEFGAHSMPYALIEIKTDGADDYDKGTEIIAPMKHDADYDVVGYLMDDVSWTDDDETAILRIQYAPMGAEDNERNKECFVGGLWMFEGQGEAVLSGCFNDTGIIHIYSEDAPVEEGWPYSYSYVDDNIRTSNLNENTFQKLAKSTSDRMKCTDDNPDCDGAFLNDFQYFVDYFGESDFADKWVSSLFSLDPAFFASGYGTAAFNELYYRQDARARSEGIRFGVSTMIVLHEMIREMELSVYQCHKKNKVQANVHLDKAYAYYSGTLEGPSGAGEGLFLYELAQLRCNQTRTCGRNHNRNGDDAYVNYEILEDFVDAQESLDDFECKDVREDVDDIIRLLKIPLIQGILRYAYENQFDDFGTRSILDGAVFMTAMLPWMDACDEDLAMVVYDNMRVRSTPGAVSYADVRSALEGMYKCFDIACEEVGGMWDRDAGEWRKNGEPCGHYTKADRASNASTFISSSKNAGKAVGITFAVLIILIVLILVALRCCKRKGSSSLDKPHVRNIAAVTEIS